MKFGISGAGLDGFDKRNVRTGKREKRRAPCDNLQTFPMSLNMTDRAGAMGVIHRVIVRRRGLAD
ncbi:hypothetical protein BTHE68_35850 [Burkholderia sp. THE68]|uniref:hypothetical protein n=1 Tax=Burkholderia sp. THE68 TaxID=758782 RepID=UPI001316AF85|nr:hypothetical protein [Burkholderia sp. THE68]BBU29851.1 hypothetical protein BTHE68_35850 [Burkholderia sp. THE68]